MAHRPPSDPDGRPRDRLVDTIRGAIPPLHPAGRPFVTTGLVLAGLGFRTPWLRRLGLGAALASAVFFRHPARVTPIDPGAVLAAADGQVCLIDEAVPPPELDWTDAPLLRVSTFLTIFDVHVQRAPVAGRVVRRVHRPGLFLTADRAEASQDNERNSLLLRTEAGVEVAVVQIAGLVARRIVCQVDEGADVTAGQTVGLIRFGSRVDLYLPRDARPTVLVGQRAVAGETVMARLP